MTFPLTNQLQYMDGARIAFHKPLSTIAEHDLLLFQTVENVSGESEDIDSKIEEYKNIIRRAETGLVKAEARLNALRGGQGE